MQYQCVCMLFTSRTTLDFVLFYLTFLFQCASKNTATIALQGSKKNCTNVTEILLFSFYCILFRFFWMCLYKILNLSKIYFVVKVIVFGSRVMLDSKC
jgi:hypothetical protein